MSEDEFVKQADSIVSNHVERYARTFSQLGVLLSGGIDSSVVTTYVLDASKNPVILSMGTDLTKDKPFIDIFSHHFTVSYEWVNIVQKDIDDAMPIVVDLLKNNNIFPSEMQRALAVGYFLIFKRAHEWGVQGVVTGQGPDILFAGYHKYQGMQGTLLESQIKKDLILLETDKRRDGAMAAHFNITLCNPYLEDDFIAFSLSVPPELKRRNEVEKYCMRMWGRFCNLPEEIVNRPKKAFQYSTGLQKKIHRKF